MDKEIAIRIKEVWAGNDQNFYLVSSAVEDEFPEYFEQRFDTSGWVRYTDIGKELVQEMLPLLDLYSDEI